MGIDWRFGGSRPWDGAPAFNPRHLLSRRHQRRSLEIGPAKPSLRWPLQRTGSVSEGQAFFPSKFRRVAIITSSSVCLWQTSSKGSLIPLGTTCDDRVRMRKPLFSTQSDWRAALEACVQWLVTSLKMWKSLPENRGQITFLILTLPEITPTPLYLHMAPSAISCLTTCRSSQDLLRGSTVFRFGLCCNFSAPLQKWLPSEATLGQL